MFKAKAFDWKEPTDWERIDFTNPPAIDAVEALARFELRREFIRAGVLRTIERSRHWVILSETMTKPLMLEQCGPLKSQENGYVFTVASSKRLE